MIYTDNLDNTNVKSHNLIREYKYLNFDKFNDLLKDKRRNDMVLVNFNMRSLPKNKTDIESLLSLMPMLPEVVAITETKLNYLNKHLIDIENYQFTHVDSTSKA